MAGKTRAIRRRRHRPKDRRGGCWWVRAGVPDRPHYLAFAVTLTSRATAHDRRKRS
jgi:hypothetical protein